MKTIREREYAFVAIKANYVAHTVQHRGAMTAVSQMQIQHPPVNCIQILVDMF
jgi:hypothetical protein